MEARGKAPRSDGLPLFESPADSRKRKAAENAAAEAAKQREIALRKRPHTGGMRYKNLPGFSNELHRMIDQPVRPAYYPPPVALWEEGKAIGMGLIAKLQDGGPLASFYPSPSLFFGIKKREKALSMVVRLVELWPTLHRRIILARSDSSVARIGSEDWRRILSGVHFKFDVGRPAGEGVDFADCEALYRYGSDAIFGRQLTARLKAGDRSGLVMGRMGCGHRVTAADVDDDQIIKMILARLTEELLHYEFAAMAPSAWRDLPAVTDKYGTYRMPSFWHPGDAQGRAGDAMRLIRQIVGRSGMAAHERGWHGSTCALRLDWILLLRRFFATYADGMEHFANQPEGEGPWDKPWRRLVHVPNQRLHKSDRARLEKLLLEAWWVCLFKIGRSPLPLLTPVACGERDMPDCKACRDALIPDDPYAQFEDEDSD